MDGKEGKLCLVREKIPTNYKDYFIGIMRWIVEGGGNGNNLTV